MRRRLQLPVMVIVLLCVLWAGTFTVALAWLLKWQLPGRWEAEPVTVLLSLITVAVTGLVAYFDVELRARSDELEEEKFSAPRALAHGYVHHFVVPLITRLLQQAGPRADEVRLFIYLPQDLDELEPDAVERTLARLRARQFATKVVSLPLEQGRPRDVLTILKGATDAPAYFDFPNTLLTLQPVVEFKLSKARNADPSAARRELAARFIQRFRAELEGLLAAKPDVRRHIRLTGPALEFLEEPAARGGVTPPG